MTIPVLRAVGAGSSYSGTNGTHAKPTGTAEGDLLLCFKTCDGVQTQAEWEALPPSGGGWALLLYNNDTADAFASTAAVFWKIAGASEPSTYAFKGGNAGGLGIIAAFSGVHQTTPFQVTSTQQLNAASSTSIAIPAITTTANDSLLVQVYTARSTNGVPYTPPSGTTEIIDFKGSTVNSNIGVATLGKATAGASGALTATSNTSSKSWAAHIALQAAPGAADTTPPTLSDPTGTTTGQTTATGSVSTNEANGTLYRLASTASTVTAATVKAAALSQAVTATGAQAVTFTGLTAGTAYYAHYVHTDAAGNDSAVASSASFTTTAAPASGTITSSALKNNTGTLIIGIAFEAFVHNVTTGALVVKKTGLTSNGSGIVTFTENAIAAGTSYRVVWKRTDTGLEGMETLTGA